MGRVTTFPWRISRDLTRVGIAFASTLELKKEKANAHAEKFGQSITGVQFSPDGTKIVSCGVDQTIKVWDAGVPRNDFSLAHLP